MAVVAQAERRMISARAKAALQAAKARGVKLGGDMGNLPAVGDKGRAASIAVRQREAAQRATDLAPIVAELRARGASSLRQIAKGLNERGIPTARGGRWSATQVQRLGL